MTRRFFLPVTLAALLLHACTQPPKPDPHYVLGPPYQSGGVWFYPRDSDDLDETGLAAVLTGAHPPLTTDGEVFDQTALAAAHPTLQLPAIARLTNLENGLQVMVRLNDRGNPDPRRLVQVTRRTATLLGMSQTGIGRVRLQVLPVESRAAVEAVPGAPKLAISPAPRGPVEVVQLAPPSGVRQGRGRPLADAAVIKPIDETIVTPPLRLPEAVVRTIPQPNRLMVRLDTFDALHNAAVQQAKMSGAGARIVAFQEGRTRQFRVQIGPLQDVARADAVLLQALEYGIPDARIVID
ncbi:RlpA-like double-psi beta-barrel domain-containing protein [Rhodopila sp.]|uniref:RlpA-like double-psi beta-barrel domain-containing protein n=1 Tax=Rhodopila sp. TaxID=2480087 RepID=UPI003D0FBA3B